MDKIVYVKQYIETGIKLREEIIKKNLAIIIEAADIITEAYQNGKTVYWMGNGGSAADAQHLACELISKLNLERASFPSISLTTNTSILTAISNDYTFDNIFSRQIQGLVNDGDVVVGLSTSGNSKNVVNGILEANNKNAVTIGLLGNKGGAIKNIVDLAIVIPSKTTTLIQESHIMIGHLICDLVEKTMANVN